MFDTLFMSLWNGLALPGSISPAARATRNLFQYEDRWVLGSEVFGDGIECACSVIIQTEPPARPRIGRAWGPGDVNVAHRNLCAVPVCGIIEEGLGEWQKL